MIFKIIIQKNKMSTPEKLKILVENSKNFFDTYVKNSLPNMPEKQFHIFRLFYLNMLEEVSYNLIVITNRV